MVEILALILFISCCCEGVVIVLLLDELRRGTAKLRWDAVADSPAPRTAQQIAKVSAERMKQKPATRKPHDWASLRNRLENHFDPENERAKRVEKFLGEDHAS